MTPEQWDAYAGDTHDWVYNEKLQDSVLVMREGWDYQAVYLMPDHGGDVPRWLISAYPADHMDGICVHAGLRDWYWRDA